MAHRYQLSGLPDHEQSHLTSVNSAWLQSILCFQCLPLTWDFQQTHSLATKLGNSAGLEAGILKLLKNPSG